MNTDQMEEDEGMECSPLEQVLSWRRGVEGRCCSKRKYQEDSGYITTPCSSQSASNSGFSSWALDTPDEAFTQSPSDTGGCWNPCECGKDWEYWERADPLLPTSPEASVHLPPVSPTQPKILRSRDLPRSSIVSSQCGSGDQTPCRPGVWDAPTTGAHPSQTDLMHRFAVQSSLPHVLALIFRYLSDSDITAMTMVSKTWYSVITRNKQTRQRWLSGVASRKSSKENFNSIEKSSWVRSPLKARNHSTPLRSLLASSASPPVSPSKVKFHLYVKEAAKLKADECLMHCPSCDLPSRCMPVEKRGKCSRVGCALEFCMHCRSPYHGSSPCVLLSPPGDRTPQKRISRAQSRRNLRRLLQ